MGKRTHIRCGLIFAWLGYLASACGGSLIQERHSPTDEETNRKLKAQEQPPPSPVSKEAEASKGPEPLVPRISVQDEKGRQIDDAQKAFSPLGQAMRECTPNQHGAITIRIISDPRHTEMGVDPRSAIGGAAGRCVLENLSTIDVDEALRTQSPVDRPSKGFTSYVRIEW